MTTEAEVIETAIEQFKKPRGFTAETYFAEKNGFWHPVRAPGERVRSTCAIGGVEQAIWKLVGKTIPIDVRIRVAKNHQPARSRARHVQLYARVMRRLNRVARELYPMLDDDDVYTVEQVTFAGGERIAKRRTLEVFTKALEEVSP